MKVKFELAHNELMFLHGHLKDAESGDDLGMASIACRKDLRAILEMGIKTGDLTAENVAEVMASEAAMALPEEWMAMIL